MRTGERQVEEKRFALGLGAGVDVLAGFAGEVPQAVDRLEFFAAWPRSVERLGHRGPLGRLVVFQIDVWIHVERSRDDERLVEADRQRAAIDLFAVVNLPAVALGWAGFGLALFAVGQHLPAKAKVPFADHRSVVMVLLQEFRDRQSVFRDQRLRQAPKHTALEVCPPIIAAGDNAVSGGRAHRRGRVRVGEPHALPGQAIAVRRRRLAAGVGEVAVAEIVGEYVNDIGPIQRQRLGQAGH